MILSHRIRLNPSPDQEAYFRQACGIARFAFNWGRAEWERIYKDGGKPSALGLKKDFNAVKGSAFPWTYDVTKSAVEGAFSDLGKAFANFFRGMKSVGYPKFKAKHRSKPTFYLANDRFDVDGHALRIQKLIGVVNMAEVLRFVGKILSGRISFKAGHWWISIQVEMPNRTLAHPGGSVGIDLGLKTLAVCSDGVCFQNPRHLAGALKKLRGLQRSLSRKVKGSSNWLKAKARVARAYARVADQRGDAIHKMTSELVRQHNLIGLEDLNVRGMTGLRSLARSLADAAFGEIRRQLEYKAPMLGSRVVVVDRWFASSKLCSACGWKKEDLELKDRSWTCGGCGAIHDRDLNAAINIRNAVIPVVASSGS